MFRFATATTRFQPAAYNSHKAKIRKSTMNLSLYTRHCVWICQTCSYSYIEVRCVHSRCCCLSSLHHYRYIRLLVLHIVVDFFLMVNVCSPPSQHKINAGTKDPTPRRSGCFLYKSPRARIHWIYPALARLYCMPTRSGSADALWIPYVRQVTQTNKSQYTRNRENCIWSAKHEKFPSLLVRTV